MENQVAELAIVFPLQINVILLLLDFVFIPLKCADMSTSVT